MWKTFCSTIEFEFEGLNYQCYYVIVEGQPEWQISSPSPFGYTVYCQFIDNGLVPAQDENPASLKIIPREVMDHFTRCLKLQAFW